MKEVIEMNVKDYAVKSFICYMLDFFHEKNIKSCLYPVENFDSLKNNIFESPLVKWNYCSNINSYDFTFKSVKDFTEEEVYLFLFQQDKSDGQSHIILIEQYKSSAGYMYTVQITIDFDIYLPFVNSLLDDKGLFCVSSISGHDKKIKLSSDEVMTMEEFIRKISLCNKNGKITLINVD